jgi:hypothetical protein
MYTTEERLIAREILLYLKKNPDAKDTLEGIMQCWLRRPPHPQVRDSIERAVFYLLSKQVLFEKHRKGLPAYYGFNTSKSEDVLFLLNSEINE